MITIYISLLFFAGVADSQALLADYAKNSNYCTSQQRGAASDRCLKSTTIWRLGGALGGGMLKLDSVSRSLR